MNTSMLLGRIAGVPVRAHWSMALIAALFSVTLTPEYGAVTALFVVFALFASILAHEIGHAVVARRFGVNTESIDLWALGGVARLDRESPTPRADGLIAVAGPATSLAIGLIAGGVGIVLQVPVVFYIGFLNIALFRVQHAARGTARRRPGHSGLALVTDGQPLPGDARRSTGGTSTRLGAWHRRYRSRAVRPAGLLRGTGRHVRRSKRSR